MPEMQHREGRSYTKLGKFGNNSNHQRGHRDKPCSVLVHGREQLFSVLVDEVVIGKVNDDLPALGRRPRPQPAPLQFLHPIACKFPFQLQSNRIRAVVYRDLQHLPSRAALDIAKRAPRRWGELTLWLYRDSLRVRMIHAKITCQYVGSVPAGWKLLRP